MKTKLVRKAKQAASALLVTLVICSILSLTVMYYLSLIDQQNYLGARSQSWNMAIAVSEAGVEDGIAQLNQNWPNLNTDGWSYQGGAIYTRSNNLPDGSSYFVSIIASNSLNPLVLSRAYVVMPPRYAKLNVNNNAFLALAGSGGGTASAGTTTNSNGAVTRAVMVTCSKANLYLAAMVARNTINLNGNGITTDSYDSGDPTKSTNGMYDSNKYKGDKGDVATDLNVVDSMNIGNANIYGHAHTGPGSPPGALSSLPNSVVASHTWAAANGNKGIQPGYYVQDANFTFPDTSIPDTASFLTPTNGPISLPTISVVTNTLGFVGNTNVVGTISSYKKNGTWYYYAAVAGTTTYDSTYKVVWGNSKYVLPTSGNIVVIGTNASLVVSNGLTGSESIVIYNDAWRTNGMTPTVPESSITVYSGGTSLSLSGQQVLNQTGRPQDFIVYAAPTVTSVSFSGNAGFTGVLVAPNADLTMNGGGNNNYDFNGSVMVNSVSMNGHFSFHYDEALSRAPADGNFIITAWNEVK